MRIAGTNITSSGVNVMASNAGLTNANSLFRIPAVVKNPVAPVSPVLLVETVKKAPAVVKNPVAPVSPVLAVVDIMKKELPQLDINKNTLPPVLDLIKNTLPEKNYIPEKGYTGAPPPPPPPADSGLQTDSTGTSNITYYVIGGVALLSLILILRK